MEETPISAMPMPIVDITVREDVVVSSLIETWPGRQLTPEPSPHSQDTARHRLQRPRALQRRSDGEIAVHSRRRAST